MRALVARGYGPPSELEVTELADPSPGPGQLLVRVAAAALNPFDLKLVTGAVREWSPISFPYVPGMDGAGTVVAAGAGVSRFAPGDEVLGMFYDPPGTFAELALIGEDSLRLARRPPELDPLRAASLPESGLTALTVLRAAHVEPGQTLLVVGATGGIGMVLVPLAASAGARIVATAAPADAAYAIALGASATVDYTAVDTAEAVLEAHPDGVDVAVDLVNAGPAQASVARAIRRGGRLVSTLTGADPASYGRTDLTATAVQLTAEPGDLQDLARRAGSGSLPVEIGGTYSLAEAPTAFADLATSHTRGKLVVAVGT